MPATDQRFEYLSINSVGGFSYHNSQKKYLHFLIDHAFRCIWAFLSKNVNAETYISCLKQEFNVQIP